VRGSRRDAERVLADMVRERETHGPTPTIGGRITLDAWIKQRLATADLSDRTRANDLDTWSRYSSPALRSTPLRDLSTAALEAYVAELRERVSGHTGRKLAPRTVQMFVSVVRAALNAAVRQRVILANPARGVVVKGGTATRKVGQALTPEEMKKFLAHDPEGRLHALYERLVFTNQVGGALEHCNVAHVFRARLKAAGLRPFRWYDLRHSFGTHLVGAGVDAKTAAQLMGHRNVTLTLTHYTHPDAGAHRAAVARLPLQRTASAGRGHLLREPLP
jgi:site-specific recombinase XerD